MFKWAKVYKLFVLEMFHYMDMQFLCTYIEIQKHHK